MYFIYVIKNSINKKLYIGRTNDIKRRWREHKKVAEGDKEKYGKNFQGIHKAMKKHGIENFACVVIAEFDDITVANEGEIFYVEFYNSYKNGYNETKGGEGFGSGSDHPMYGTHPSLETRAKLSAARKGKTPHKGVLHSPEAKAKMSIQRKGSGNAMYGKHHSEEGKKNISNSLIGKPSPLKGRKMTEEQCIASGQRVALAFSKLKGEDRPNAKLTNEQVAEIRQLAVEKNKTHKQIWEAYNISKPTFYRIIRFATYKL